MTGVIDRLERGGWVVRERDPDDRRGVVVQPLRPPPGREIAPGCQAGGPVGAAYSSAD
jgi:MarR family